MLNFFIALLIIGIPSYAFYRVGISAGIQRGVRRQLLRELIACGIVEQAVKRTNSPWQRVLKRHISKRNQSLNIG